MCISHLHFVPRDSSSTLHRELQNIADVGPTLVLPGNRVDVGRILVLPARVLLSCTFTMSGIVELYGQSLDLTLFLLHCHKYTPGSIRQSVKCIHIVHKNHLHADLHLQLRHERGVGDAACVVDRERLQSLLQSQFFALTVYSFPGMM